jgi:hypothetical protein
MNSMCYVIWWLLLTWLFGLKKAEYCVFLVSLYTLFRSFYGGRRPAANIAYLPNADVSESEWSDEEEIHDIESEEDSTESSPG